MKRFNFAAIRNFILTHKLLSLLVICVIGVGHHWRYDNIDGVHSADNTNPVLVDT